MLVVTLAMLGFTGNHIRRSELALDDEQNVERVFTDLSWSLTLTLGDLRAALQAYVAAGQDHPYWTAKASSHLDTVRSGLDNLRRLASNPTSIEALDAAAVTVADLESLDRRAREHVGLEQQLLASDLIFTNGLELAARAAANVELARATERTTRNETIRTTRSSQATLALTAGGMSLLAVLLLIPIPRKNHGPAPFESLDPEATEALPGPAPLSSTADAESPAMSGDAAPDITATPVGQDRSPVPDLRVAADLCTDLGKLKDTSELPALLARAATLMNATGVIVWVVDASGHALRPAIGHGYTTRALARMGSIPEDGDNATAAAYRSAHMQIIESDGTSSGALAAPLLAADRSVGVLSAELREGWESSEAVQATVAIMAAQFATLLSADAPADTAAPSAEAHG